jgi:hypothetical protein
METNFVSEFVMTKVSIIAYLEDEICDFWIYDIRGDSEFTIDAVMSWTFGERWEGVNVFHR